MSNIGNIEKLKKRLAENQAEKAGESTARTSNGVKHVVRCEIEAAQRGFLNEQAKKQAIAAFKDEVKDDVIAEVKIEIRDSVVQRLKNEYRAKVISDLKEEVFSQVMAEVKEEVQQQAIEELKAELYDEVYDELRNELHDHVIQGLEEDNLERVEIKLYDEMRDNVYADLTEMMRPQITVDLEEEIRAELEPKLLEELHSQNPKQLTPAPNEGKAMRFSKDELSLFVTDDEATAIDESVPVHRGTKRALSAVLEGNGEKGDFQDQLLSHRGYHSDGTHNHGANWLLSSPFKRQQRASSFTSRGSNNNEELIENHNPSGSIFDDDLVSISHYDNGLGSALQNPFTHGVIDHDHFGSTMYEESDEEDNYEDESKASSGAYDSEEEFVDEDVLGSSKDTAIALDSDDE